MSDVAPDAARVTRRPQMHGCSGKICKILGSMIINWATVLVRHVAAGQVQISCCGVRVQHLSLTHTHVNARASFRQHAHHLSTKAQKDCGACSRTLSVATELAGCQHRCYKRRAAAAPVLQQPRRMRCCYTRWLVPRHICGRRAGSASSGSASCHQRRCQPPQRRLQRSTGCSGCFLSPLRRLGREPRAVP